MGTLRLQSLKMLVVFLIPLLGFVHGTCWYEKLCKDDQLDGDNRLDLTKEKSAEACQEKCRNNADCGFFEYKPWHGEDADCYLLKDCTQEVVDNDPHTNAGPKECPKIKEFCPGIENSEVSWHCDDKDGNELSDTDRTKPPVNSKCYTNCRGDVRESKCVVDPEDSSNFVWTTTTDEKLGIPSDKEAKCDCDPIDLKGKNPNKEAGTLLHCKEPLTYCDDKNPTKLESKNAPCRLFCYDIEQLSFRCEDGEWKTDIHEIENISGDDLYCYNQDDTLCPQK